MRRTAYGLSLDVPSGWSSAILRRPVDAPDAPRRPAAPTAPTRDAARRGRRGPGRAHPARRPRLHPRRCPPTVGDFGGGVVEVLAPDDVFVALLEYGSDLAGTGLFERQGVPRLAPSQFAPNRMPRDVVGRSASQHFFSVGGRAFCLFTVLGSHSRRMATVPRAAAVVRDPDRRVGGDDARQRGDRVTTQDLERHRHAEPDGVAQPRRGARAAQRPRAARRPALASRVADPARASSSAPPWPARPSRRTPRRTPSAADGLRDHLRARQHRVERLDDLLRHDQQGRQRLPAGQLHRGLVEGRRLLVVRRRLPLHRRLQRQVHEVHQRVAPTTSATASAGTARARPGRRPRATSAATAATPSATASATPR